MSFVVHVCFRSFIVSATLLLVVGFVFFFFFEFNRILLSCLILGLV